jgi:SEC-C motif
MMCVSGGVRTLASVPSRNEPCSCGSGRKYKRCCLERLETVARELRERDRVLGDVIEWLRDEHQQALEEARAETTLIRLLRGPIGRSMSLVWALNDYVPVDGGPPLMVRYAQLPDLDPGAREVVRGLAEARLGVYRVGATVQDLCVEVEPLLGGAPVRLPLRDGSRQLQAGEILVARLVTATTMPTPWGHGACFAAHSERRWRAQLAALAADTAQAALSVLGFHPDDAAEPLPDRLRLYTMVWQVDGDDAVCETLEAEEGWECIGQAIPSGWAFSWPDDRASEALDLGGLREGDGETELARLIVCEREMTLLSADYKAMIELAAVLEESLGGLITPRSEALAA